MITHGRRKIKCEELNKEFGEKDRYGEMRRIRERIRESMSPEKKYLLFNVEECSYQKSKSAHLAGLAGKMRMLLLQISDCFITDFTET